jgi:hypothetical protein
MFYASVALLAAAQAEFRVLDLSTTKPTPFGEVRHAPQIGEPYRLTAVYEIPAEAAGGNTLEFSLAGLKSTVRVENPEPGVRSATAEFRVPLDGLLPISVRIVPDRFGRGPYAGVAGAEFHSEFSPVPPAKAVEFYDPVTISGTQSITYSFQPGAKISRMAVMMGQPDTDSWQKFKSGSCMIAVDNVANTVAARKNETPYVIPVYFAEKKNISPKKVKFSQKFTLEVRNVRVNADELRKVTWKDLENLQAFNVFRHLTQPESVIQSNDPVIANFVKGALGSQYKKTMTPYDAAKKVFQAVLKHITYYYPKPGEKDERAHNAVDLVKKKQGDCGSFSLLLVACFRNMGIPARTACGAWLGTDAGHCWSEMYFPRCGWVLSDGAAGNSVSEDGSSAPYFGNMDDLNARFAMMRGNTFKIGSVQTAWLQGPMWPPVIEGSATLDKVEAQTVASEVASFDAGNASARASRARASRSAPRWNEGGIQVRPSSLQAYVRARGGG